MENSIIEKIKRAIATEIKQLFQEGELIAKKDGDIIELKSIKEIQIKNCTGKTEYNFDGMCKIEEELGDGVTSEYIYNFYGKADLHLKCNDKNDITAEVKEIVDNTIFVSKN